MATSDSEDFESADEGFDAEDSPKKKSPAEKVKQAEEKAVPTTPAPAQPTQEKGQIEDEPVSEGAWEPEDLDDDILDGIEEVKSAIEKVEISEKVPEPKEEIEPEQIKEVEEVQVDKEDVKVEEPKKERRQRPVREAKIGQKSASSKKLGSKIAAPEPKPDPEEIKSKEEVPVPDEEVKDEQPLLDNVPSVLDKLSSAAEQPSTQSSVKTNIFSKTNRL
jgi:hypothetical protein